MSTSSRGEDGARAYKGSAPATNDLLSGRSSGSSIHDLAAHRGRPAEMLCILGEKRWPVSRRGDLEGAGAGKIGGDAWYGILAAKGTPQPAIDKLAKAIGEGGQGSGPNEKLVTSGNTPASRIRPLSRRTIDRERQSFGDIIKKGRHQGLSGRCSGIGVERGS